MNTFKLRHPHRYKALCLAVARLESKHTNPIYQRRALIVEDIASQAWTILQAMSDKYDGYRDFVASGLAIETKSLDLTPFGAMLTGRYQIQNNIQIWPLVMSEIAKKKLMGFEPTGQTHVERFGSVVSFNRLNNANLLPQASLGAVIALKIESEALKIKQDSIKRALEIDIPAINAEIAKVFDDVEAIATGIANCDSSSDLFAMFPAAEALFEKTDSTVVEQRTQHASQILAAL